jgi:short-subunit dehydrogenase
MSTTTLSNTTTLITGAGSGIGRATARLFARHGGSLILTGRDRDALEALKLELDAMAPVRIVEGDVSDAGSWRRTMVEVARTTAIDFAILNAGIGQYGPFERSDWTELENVLRTNIDGVLATAHAVLPGMIERRAGSIVIISSILGKRAIPWNAVYCASKFALQGFADALRLEVRAHGVHVGVVGPARTSTNFFSRLYSAVPHAPERNLPTATPDSVAKAILTMIRRRRREMMLTPGGKLLAYAGLHFPRISDAIISRAIRRPE